MTVTQLVFQIPVDIWIVPNSTPPWSINTNLPPQFNSVTQSCRTLCDPVDCSRLGFPVHHQLQSLLKLVSIESVMPSNHLILCHPFLLPPSIFSSESFLVSQFFVSGGQSIGVCFSISPSNEYSGLISFRMD